MPVIAWILAGVLLATLLLAGVLWRALRHSRAHAAAVDELVAEARKSVRVAADEEAAAQAELLRVAISRAHADLERLELG